MTDIRRREFLGTAALTSAAVMRGAAAASPNDKVVVAVIGLGGQGKGHVGSYSGLPNVEVAYVCDLDEARLAEGNKIAPNAKPVSDLRKILDDKSVDAVSIATPDHWHTPAALLALQAGKHVYVEKPCCHNVREGRMLVDAAKKAGKIVQHGTQSRSAPFIQAGIKMLREGLIGEILIARAWNVQFRGNIGKAQPTNPPQGFDYDNWVGPAPFVPFQSNRAHYTWHWWYDFGTGDAGNDGVHEIDIARWGLGVETHPSSVAAVGGKYFHDDDQQFPDTMTAAFEYPGDGAVGHRRQLTFEMRLWSTYYPNNIDNGNEFLGTKGRMLLTKRGKLEVFDGKSKRIDVDLPEDKSVGIRPHQLNFVEGIRTGSPVNADAMTGHLSSALPHLGNIACRVGRSYEFDPVKEEIIGDEEANRLLGRSYREGHWGTPKAG
ncbi:MAG: Gfo/Idh/MocA family oxidoreductase [Planctomycetaceae bacterium]|nr:Gfo/Idh/MocA family oxidoreductase [Planctomycetaceae bacterium]